MWKYIKLSKDEKVKMKNWKLYRVFYENNNKHDTIYTIYTITEFYIYSIYTTCSWILIGWHTKSRIIKEYSVNKQNGEIDYSIIKWIELNKNLETDRDDDNANLIPIIWKKYKSKFSQKLHNLWVIIREFIRTKLHFLI